MFLQKRHFSASTSKPSASSLSMNASSSASSLEVVADLPVFGSSMIGPAATAYCLHPACPDTSLPFSSSISHRLPVPATQLPAPGMIQGIPRFRNILAFDDTRLICFRTSVISSILPLRFPATYARHHILLRPQIPFHRNADHCFALLPPNGCCVTKVGGSGRTGMRLSATYIGQT